MSVDAMNFNSVEVCSPPNFKRSLSHQFKKLMCYNRHLNRDKIIRSSPTVDLASVNQQANNCSSPIYSNVIQTGTLRNRYEEHSVFLQNILPSAVDRNMPKEKFGDIVMGMMTMPELPPFGSADIQQVVPFGDNKTEKRGECEKQTENRCRNYYNNAEGNGGCLYSQEGNYRRHFPPPSGADKPAFLDFPSSSSPYRQNNFPAEEIEPHSLSLSDEYQPPQWYPSENAKQKGQRNSGFQPYQKDEPVIDNKRRPMLDESSSSNYSFDFPVPSGADKMAFLDSPTGLPEEPILIEKFNGMPSHQPGHSDLQHPLYLLDDFGEDSIYDEAEYQPGKIGDISKSYCGTQNQIPPLVHCNQHKKSVMPTCTHGSQMTHKRKPCCSRLTNLESSSSSCCQSHRKHISSCSNKEKSNLVDVSLKPENNNFSEFHIGTPFSLESSSINSPASTINSSDISFDLSQGSDFPQSKSGTSVPQRRGPGRPRKPENERKRKPTKSIPLWKFLLNMLHDPATCPELVRWEDTSKGMFRIVRSDQVAAKWGMRKDNTKMNYEKFSRAMRYYYKQHIFEAVPGKRLVYQFGRAAKEWKPKNMANPNFDHRHHLD